MLPLISQYNMLQTLAKLFLLQDDTISTGKSSNSTVLWAVCPQNCGHFLVKARHILLLQASRLVLGTSQPHIG